MDELRGGGAERQVLAVLGDGEDGPAQTLRYGEVQRDAERLGGLFFNWGLTPGARLLIASDDDALVITAVIACLLFGVTAVVVDPSATGSEAAQILERAAPAAAVVDEALSSRWPTALALVVTPAAKATAMSRLLRRSGATGWRGALATQPSATPPTGLDPTSDAYVLFTSGSTARPRGVRISRAALRAHADTLIRHWGYTPESRILNVLPLHHTDGLIQGPVVTWLCGARLLRPLRFTVSDTQRLLASVWRDRATHLIAVPTLLSLLLRHAEGYEDSFSGEDFRLVLSTAGVLSPALWRAFEDRFGATVTNTYGLTETVVGACFAGPGPTRRVGTVGKAVDCELALTDDGELLIRGAMVMTGYLGDPEATAAALQGGWLRTGDLATIDEEGFVRITGRRKNLVISGGRNIQPEEVSEALEALPGVAAAAAFGLPDPVFGEILVAAVAPLPGHSLTEAALAAGCRERLSAFKVPQVIVVVPELLRGPAGKLRLPAARAAFAAHRGGPPIVGEGVEARVRALAAGIFKLPVSSLTASDGPDHTPGWDSFAHLRLVVALEEAFGLTLTTAEIMAMRSLGEVEQLVRARTAGG